MASATAMQTPENTRKTLIREVSRLVCEMRILFHDVETDIVLLAQRKCPVTGLVVESCKQCRNAALGNVPFVLGRRHAHLSELEAMIDALSPELREMVKKSPLFH